MLTSAERAALDRALDLAATPGVPPGPNPRVGCVILSPQGEVIGEGFHRGAGTPHAEVAALAVAGAAARGATAVVSLEPCNHQGRTGPCAQALLEAGIAKVVYALPDPTPQAGGGAERLSAAGVQVVAADGEQQARARDFLEPWTASQTWGRPFVTVKMAATLDGRIAASDGTSRWITGPESRRDVHRLRANADAVVVGRGTVVADDPSLTVRDVDAGGYQPLRVIVGRGDLPADCSLVGVQDGSVLHLRTHEPEEVLASLFERGVRHVLVEGGPTLVSAWLQADVVDRLVWFIAPVILGSGPSAVGDIGVSTMSDASRWQVVSVDRFGEDARIVAARTTAPTRGAAERET